MPRSFDIPQYYRSDIISAIKAARQESDPRRRDITPSVLDLGRVRFKIARHFGFCFGVQNAIEIAYRALLENPEKRVYLLSEMIHNPHVNRDLQSRGVRFLMSTYGEELIPLEQLKPEDIVIVPAFGTSVQTMQRLRDLGITPEQYDTTCPFVEKVWKKSKQLGSKGYTIIVHGKHVHEETRATFSHASTAAPTLVIRDMEEARLLAQYIRTERETDDFYREFAGRFSKNFDVERDLQRIGVVNQTTMLAAETKEIAAFLRNAVQARVGGDASAYFADTRDTLCYATSENQDAVHGLIETGADFAVVVGGYNSSNTSHLVELLEQAMPTYYIKDAREMISAKRIRHRSLQRDSVLESEGWLPLDQNMLEVAVTAGASCPDVLVDEVVVRIAEFLAVQGGIGGAVSAFSDSLTSEERPGLATEGQ